MEEEKVLREVAKEEKISIMNIQLEMQERE